MTATERHTRLVNLIERQSDMITFVVGKQQKVMKCAGLCMSAISCFFEILLDNRKESDECTPILMKDVEPAIFEFIIDWAYGKEVCFDDKNIISIMRMADKYQMILLLKKCDEQFTKIINVYTICNILNDTVKQRCTYYQNKTLELFQSYFGYYAQQIIETDGFMKMDLESMIIFLKLDCLNVAECKLYDMVLKWTTYQTDNGSNDHLLKSVCKNIRFATMKPAFLASKRKEINIVLAPKDFANILCYATKQDPELAESVGRKFILTKRKFDGYGMLLPYYPPHRSIEFDIIKMRSVVNIRRIEIMTISWFDAFDKIHVKYLDDAISNSIIGSDENDWISISRFDNKKVILCDIITRFLRFERQELNLICNPFEVITACRIFGF